MTTPEIAAIAKGLTKAQRVALAEGKWSYGDNGKWMQVSGLAVPEPVCMLRLTPLGLAVRDAITAALGEATNG